MQTDMYICKLSPTLPPSHHPFLFSFTSFSLNPFSISYNFSLPVPTPLHLYMCLFQISGVSLDGLFDAEQHRGQPLVQAGHRVKLLHSLCERLAVLLLVGLKEFL